MDFIQKQPAIFFKNIGFTCVAGKKVICEFECFQELLDDFECNLNKSSRKLVRDIKKIIKNNKKEIDTFVEQDKIDRAAIAYQRKITREKELKKKYKNMVSSSSEKEENTSSSEQDENTSSSEVDEYTSSSEDELINDVFHNDDNVVAKTVPKIDVKNKEDITHSFSHQLNDDKKEIVRLMNILNKMDIKVINAYNEGYSKGCDEGYSKGYDEGYSKGHSDGKISGKKKYKKKFAKLKRKN